MSVLCRKSWDTQTEVGIVHCARERGHVGEHRYSPDGQQSFSWGRGVSATLADAIDLIGALTDDELRAAFDHLEERQPGSRAKMREFLRRNTSVEPAWPARLPKELYLVTHVGLWPIFALGSEDHAISAAEKRGAPGHDPVIYRVVRIEVEEMAVQREVIRQALVPKGTEVTS